MPASKRQYIAIDLKSFYASVECVERGLNALTTNLVVADATRTDKTICLAVSPSLKAHGTGGRPRLFEVHQRLREVNNRRRYAAPGRRLTGKSWSDPDLQAHPDWEVDFIIAPPRMALYIDYSTRIFDIYMRYVAPEDIHVYSIDEVFIDATSYLAPLSMTAHELAMTMIRDVLANTGITATAGIGTNMYLSKVAMDIVAKRMEPDADGVRIAELDEPAYRRTLWDHEPLTDFWRVGHGIMARLAHLGIYTMGDLARASLTHENVLFKVFGINAELLIDHAWGWEPVTIDLIKAYRPETHSLSNGQVLTRAYTAAEALVVIKEMAEGTAFDLLDKELVADQMVIDVGYDIESLNDTEAMQGYRGEIVRDHYGRLKPKSTHGSENFGHHTFSARTLVATAERLFRRVCNPTLLVRRLNVTVNHVIPEEEYVAHTVPTQLDIFTDFETLQAEKRARSEALEKERRLMAAALAVKKKFGKNAMLKGIDYHKCSTSRQRNKQIGGHKA